MVFLLKDKLMCRLLERSIQGRRQSSNRPGFSSAARPASQQTVGRPRPFNRRPTQAAKVKPAQQAVVPKRQVIIVSNQRPATKVPNRQTIFVSNQRPGAIVPNRQTIFVSNQRPATLTLTVRANNTYFSSYKIIWLN